MSGELAQPLKRHEWHITVKLKAPFRTGGQQATVFGVDDTLLRIKKSRDEWILALSGFQMFGYFKHFLTEVRYAEEEEVQQDNPLVPIEIFHRWFGESGRQLFNAEIEREGADSDPSKVDDRGLLTIRDIPITEDGTQSKSRTRIKIDPTTDSVLSGAWQVFEQSHETGATVTFTSRSGLPGVALYCSDAEAALFEHAFKVFAKGLVALGANKGQGFGGVIEPPALERVSNATFSAPEIDVAGGETISVLLRFNDPVLVDPQLMSGNVHRGSKVIPGSVIKAALAEYGRHLDPDFDQNFGQVLSDVVIRYGLPVNARSFIAGNSVRPEVPPFNLVATSNGSEQELVDFFALPETAPVKFSVDFKNEERAAVATRYPPHEVTYVTRTRTAIKEGLFSAKPHHLFNYQSVCQFTTQWHCQIVVPSSFDDAQRATLRKLLKLLGSGNILVGKTRAQLAELTLLPNKSTKKAEMMPAGRNIWHLELQTPAFLLNIARQKELRSGADLGVVYRRLFEHLLSSVGNAVEWDSFDFLARHEWAGGARAVRYTQFPEDGGYHPYLLTSAGSVFRIPAKAGANEVELTKLAAALAHFQKLGLPLPDTNLTWRDCPYVPNNGFGEVRVVHNPALAPIPVEAAHA